MLTAVLLASFVGGFLVAKILDRVTWASPREDRVPLTSERRAMFIEEK